MVQCDFHGWATRNNVECSDGRVIRRDAFKDDNGKKVPLVWNHQHNNPENILGHAILENRDEGVYAYCTFNQSESGKSAKLLVEHGDISALSIYANQLQQTGSNVMHGSIREVSLVLAGANPEAFIRSVIKHGESSDEEAIMYFYTGNDNISLSHSDEEEKEPENTMNKDESASMSHADESAKSDDNETIADIFNTLNEKQKTAVYAMIGQALESGDTDETDDTADDAEHSAIDEESDNTEGGNNTMKHNLFEQQGTQETEDNVLSHDAMQTIIGDAKRYGSMKESFLQHAATYGIDQVDWLFPEAKTLNNPPEFISRDMDWVQKVMGAVHHTPFSRIKSVFADITEDDARAKGYIKGKLKKEEVFSLLKRTTTPTTVYKKQKMDRDDVVDITDFDVIAWLKGEMRMMLNEELARAYLVGDGRLASSDDKINEQNIRPIWKDEELFTIRARFNVSAGASADDKAKAFIRAAIKARKDYKGSGNPTLYTTEDILTDCLLLTDANGRDLYDSVEKLRTKLRVKEIVTVPVMEGLTRNGDGNDSGSTYELWGLIVNLADYNVGADKGGAINMFEDFDIDYNQQKYLIETRCSAALTKPFSAIALELKINA